MKRILIPLIVSLPLFLATSSANAADKAKNAYPLDTCVVSGEKLGEMAEPYIFTYHGHEVRLCCKDCLKKFNKDPERYVKKLESKGANGAANTHESHHH